ncbi:MAG: tRNA (guanosine(37)-N1)-methyltransferase TrmD [candidate division NC10 bacterium]|nr:tRNA (guanosine(37)-N1)-methyltransferase TrmD [candidate division NC10 bacterium]
MVRAPLRESILRRSQEKGLLKIRVVDFRNYARDKHRVVDDLPFGGGPGMVLKAGPIFAAVRDCQKDGPPARVLLMSPQGRRFDQEMAKGLAQEDHLIFICGRYEGVDERVREALVTDEISIGDYVLSGGELPALVVIEALSRLIPGVLGDEDSARGDSFYEGLLDHPHYTRPACFEGMEVPPILISGHHEQIRRWRRKEALRRTRDRRPDLLEIAPLSEEDRLLLQEIAEEKNSGSKEKSR